MSSCFLRWFFFQTFPLPFPLLLTFPIPFPLLKFVLLINYFLSFFHLKFSEMPNFQKIHDASLKPKQKTSTKQFFKGVVHEQPWSTIVCVVGGFTIVSSCFLRWFFFQTFPLPFPLLLTFPIPFPLLKFFLLINYFLSFFHLKFSEMPNFQKIHDASLKPKQKNINQTIFQGGSPWATLIHNSMCGWRVH